MDEARTSGGRSSMTGYPAGVAGRLSFRVLESQPPAATVIAPMCLSVRLARAVRLTCLETALGLLLVHGPVAPAPASAQPLERVEYSSIVDSLLPQQRGGGLFVEDAGEIHLGAEYAFFAGTSVLAVRVGAWHDPDHYLGVRENDPLLRTVFVPGEYELHLATGLGIALRNLHVDLGIDLSDRIDTAPLSVIYSFPG